MKIITKFRNHFIVLSFYFGLGIIFTYPLIFNLTKGVVGGGGDVYQTIGIINNNFERFKELGYLKSIWFTLSRLKLDPITINTYLHYFFKQPVSYNLFWFFSFVVSSFGVFLLVKFIFYNLNFRGFTATAAAFTAGFIYSFNPAHFAWGMGFRGATHIEWIPFTTLYFLKFIKKPSFKNLLLLGLFFLLLITGESHFAAYYIIFLIPLLIFYLSQNHNILKNKLFIRYSLFALVLGVFLAFWLYLPLIKVSVSKDNYLNPGIEQTIRYSPDILSIITPTEFHPFWSEYFAPIREAFTRNIPTHSNYLGFTALILFVFSFFYVKRSKMKEIYFWSLSAIGFFILSLGPFLHYLGTIEPKIPLPYLFLYQYVPFFENIRAVGRLWVIALLCFSVAIAFGIKFLFDHLSKKNISGKVILFFAIILLIFLEYLPIPIPFSSLDYSPFYDQIKTKPGDFSIVDIPGSTNYVADAKTKYYASIYQKGLISGLDPARKIPGKWDLQKTTPVLSEILYTLPKGKGIPTDIIIHNYSELANKTFSYFNIPYIIIQKEFVGFEQDYILPYDFDKLNNFITANFDIEQRFEDKYLIAYKVKEKQPTDFIYLTIGDNWEELDASNKTRQIKNEASLKIYNQFSTTKNLSLNLHVKSPKDRYGTVSFYFKNELLGNYFVYEKSTPINLVALNIPVGENDLVIKVTNYSKYGENKSGSVSFEDISYKVIEKPAATNDFNLLNDDYDKAVIETPPYLSYYFQEALNGTVKKEINNHPLIFLEDLVIENEEGNYFLLNKLPLLNELFNVEEEKYSNLEAFRDIRELNYYSDNVANIIADKNIGYIYTDKSTLNKKSRDMLTQYLNKYIQSLETVNGNEFTIYRINSIEKNNSIPFVFGSGWDVLENKFSQSKRRKIYASASLFPYSQNNQKAVLKFKSRTCPNQTINGSVEINGEDDKIFTVEDSDFKEITIELTHPLEIGFNNLTIRLSSEPQQFTDNANKLDVCPIWVSDVSIYSSE